MLATRYGNYAMEILINEILKNGGVRENIEVKIFGGGRVLKNSESMDIGNLNVQFVKDYLRTENLTIQAEDLGGEYSRKLHYSPRTGRIKMKKIISLNNNYISGRDEIDVNDIKK